MASPVVWLVCALHEISHVGTQTTARPGHPGQSDRTPAAGSATPSTHDHQPGVIPRPTQPTQVITQRRPTLWLTREHTALADVSAPRLTYGTGSGVARSNGAHHRRADGLSNRLYRPDREPFTPSLAHRRPHPEPNGNGHNRPTVPRSGPTVHSTRREKFQGSTKGRLEEAYSSPAQPMLGHGGIACPQVLYTPCG